MSLRLNREELHRNAWFRNDLPTMLAIETCEEERANAWDEERNALQAEIEDLKQRLEDLEESSGLREAARLIRSREENARRDLSEAHGALMREVALCVASGALKRAPARKALTDRLSGTWLGCFKNRPTSTDPATVRSWAEALSRFRNHTLGA